MQKLWMALPLLIAMSCSSRDKHDDNKPQPQPSPSAEVEHKYAVIKGEGGLKYHTGLLPKPEGFQYLGDSHVRLTDCGPLPDSFDLRQLGLVSEIRDQGAAGTCWAHSMVGSLESALRGQGISLDLSEQELVSCDKDNYGVEGGLLDDFKYLIKHGTSLEKEYPYTSGKTGRNGTCKSASVAAKGVSFQYVGTSNRGPTEDELKCALYKNKTVPWITVGATNAWGSPPSSEKTAYSRCGSAQTNHAVGVVGWWKDSKGKTQFIMKNSWGLGWGDKGYMSLPLGCNNFGEEVAFIEVEKKPDPSPTPTPPGPTPTPTPGPCEAPKVKMAAEIQVFPGTEVMLGVKPEKDVIYSWTFEDKVVVGNEAMLYVTPMKDGVYKLSGKNACAVTESQVRVRIVHSFR